MKVSDLQSKDIINQRDGKNLGRIIDIDILENGMIDFFVVEQKKFIKKISFTNREINIKLNQILKIGEDIILVDLP